MRVAVIDCGTNTIRLLVADAGPDGTPAEVVRDLRLVRLGQGVDATRTFHPDALTRTFAASGALGASRSQVIRGDEEARLAYLGALSGGRVASGPVLVMDVGGGSTELILGDLDGTIRAARSLDVGSVRIRERLLHGDPPTAAEIAAARSHVAGLVRRAAARTHPGCWHAAWPAPPRACRRWRRG